MWNPTRNRQAEDREHRIGQVNRVQIIDIIAKDTVDLGRNQRIANKWEALEYILGDKVYPEQYRQVNQTDQEFLVEAATHDAIAMFGGQA
jgi:SNF2 family DNA or RNA helicase